MTPVISPWVFYAISVVAVVKIIAVIFVIVFGAIAFAATVVAIANCLDYGEDDEDYLKWKSLTKWATLITSICLILAIFIPSEQTITKMIVAQNVTYERVEVVTDTAQTVYEDIMNLFEDYDDGE